MACAAAPSACATEFEIAGVSRGVAGCESTRRTIPNDMPSAWVGNAIAAAPSDSGP